MDSHTVGKAKRNLINGFPHPKLNKKCCEVCAMSKVRAMLEDLKKASIGPFSLSGPRKQILADDD